MDVYNLFVVDVIVRCLLELFIVSLCWYMRLYVGVVGNLFDRFLKLWLLLCVCVMMNWLFIGIWYVFFMVGMNYVVFGLCGCMVIVKLKFDGLVLMCC